MKRFFFIIFVTLLAGCEPISGTAEITPSKEVVTQTDDENTQGADTNRDDTVKYPPNSHIRLEDIEIAVKNLVEPTDEVEKKDKVEREKDDLKAQETVADYTRYMFWAGLVGLIFTAIGIALIWRQLKQTQKAITIAAQSNEVADKAASAAMASADDARHRTQLELQPGIVVTEIVSVDFLMQRHITEGPDAPYTELRVHGMERKGNYWFQELPCTIHIKVKNWGRLPVYGVDVRGSISIQSAHHERPIENELKGSMVGGRQEFIAPESEETIEIPFGRASFYTQRARFDEGDDYSGRTNIILDNCSLFMMGEVFFRDEFTKEGEVRVLNFSWGSMYNREDNRNENTDNVRISRIRTVNTAAIIEES